MRWLQLLDDERPLWDMSFGIFASAGPSLGEPTCAVQ